MSIPPMTRRGYSIEMQAEMASESLHQVGYPVWETGQMWQECMKHCVRVVQEGNDVEELYRQFVMAVGALQINVETPAWDSLVDTRQTGFTGFIRVINALNGTTTES